MPVLTEFLDPPLDYGDAHDVTALHAPLNRWGGNSTSRYNWRIDAHSAAGDWFFETYSDGSGSGGGTDGHAGAPLG